MPFIEHAGTRLHYRVEGQGEPLLFIHGLGSSLRDWEAQQAFFAKDFQVIALDLRGHGGSDKPPGPYAMPLFASDCLALLDRLGVGPAHVVGISMGGMIAFQLALDAPRRVRSLSIVNSGPELVIRGLRDRLKVWQRRLIVRLLGMRKLGEVLGQRLFPDAGQEPLRQTFARRWAENDPRAYRAAFQSMLGWSVAGQLKEITCPTLVIAAEHDYTSVASKQAYVDRLPDARLAVIADARHALPVERPEAFNHCLRGFLVSLA